MKSGDNFKGAKVPFEKLDSNIEYIKNVFLDDDTLITRFITSPINSALKFCLAYIDGMVNNKLLNDDVIRPLLEYRFPAECDSIIDTISKKATFSNSVERTSDIEEIIQGIVYGDTVLFVDGYNEALVINTKGWTMRAITEPQGERVLKGPREGFNESILVNLSMLRRKLRTSDLKMNFRAFGRRTKTKACICYLDSLVNKNILKELEKRLKKIDIDSTLDTNYISEIIRDSHTSPIKTIGTTERPDIVAAKLLEGRVALFLDGTPVVLTLPYLFIENFQSDEDYYLSYFFASIGRILRIIAFFISISLPAIYLSLVTFHLEMLPTSMLISISTSRQGVPFPTAVEALLLLLAFEMLRESGARMPGMMGQALSIVGALVLGQAAVTAKIVSAPIIIVVALTGISGMMLTSLKGFMVIVRFFLIITSCILGMYGYMLGILVMLASLFHITSFGVPIMPDVYATEFQDYKDTYARFSWKLMIKRPKFLTKDKIRQSPGGENNDKA